MRTRVGALGTVGGYGHVGDGNIHINIAAKSNDRVKEVHDLIFPYVLEEVGRRKGSISAEHGIGYAKAPYLHLTKSDAYIETMRVIKKTLDPNGIMCPGKVLTLQ